jgi:hypothetical protein
MAREDLQESSQMNSRPLRVEAPRAGDALGFALRDAYERDLGLPEDMAAMLRRLNGGFTREIQ